MKLWLLEPLSDLEPGFSPWVPWYDKAFGFVVRAETEEQARELAHAQGGDENRAEHEPWKNPLLSSCKELTAEGPAEVVIQDFKSA